MPLTITVRRRTATLALAATASLAAAGVAGAEGRHHMHMAPYPDLSMASERDQARASALARRTWANVPRFRNWRTAQRLGYRVTPGDVDKRPRFLHLRRNGAAMWGGLLDARTPQALVYWLPPAGRPTLVAYMYRAPADAMPPTYGDIIHWHTHGGATQMTHVWLTRDLRSQFARCAPIAQLERVRHIHWSRSAAPEIDADKPCRDKMSDGEMHHHDGMGMGG